MSSTEIHAFRMFGRGKVFLRHLVLHNCLPAEKKGERRLEIARALRGFDGSYRSVESNVDYLIDEAANSLILHDIFMDERFGIVVRFLNRCGGVEFSKTNESGANLIEFMSLDGTAGSVNCFVDVRKYQ